MLSFLDSSFDFELWLSLISTTSSLNATPYDSSSTFDSLISRLSLSKSEVEWNIYIFSHVTSSSNDTCYNVSFFSILIVSDTLFDIFI